MTRLRLTLEVARWEFWRFFKIKDKIIGILVMIAVVAAFAGVRALLTNTEGPEARIVVLDSDYLELEPSAESHLQIVPQSEQDLTEDELRSAVASGELDGLLAIRTHDQAELFVSKAPSWKSELNTLLTVARREAKIKAAGLSEETLQTVLAPVQLDVQYDESGGSPAGVGETVFAIVFVSLMLMGVITGNAYLFTGITAEKTQRVTEQVVSAISPQTWIDGKILGLSAIALVSVLNMVIGSLLSLGVLNLLGTSIDVPFSVVSPMLAIQFLIMTILGFFFWFAFFAAIAATIDDPNTSARSSFMLFPLLPLAAAFGVLSNPDSWIMKLLGIIPLTAPAVMPARLVMTDVAVWEFLLAVGLLFASIWGLRRIAGKVFSLGILMHGKEPSWREMWRCLRTA